MACASEDLRRKSTPRNSKNWNLFVFVFKTVSDLFSMRRCNDHAERRKRGAVVAAHPGVVGDEEETSEKAPATGKQRWPVDDADGVELERILASPTP
jgi:hypothetical protein